jgi:prevent-host-death family protein
VPHSCALGVGAADVIRFFGLLRISPLTILSKIDITKAISATDAKQRLAALLDATQREPVVIRRQNRDVAVIMSAEEYERIRDLNAAVFATALRLALKLVA